jgi:PleD family two-component response regulator
MRPARDSSTNRNTEGQALNAERATPITVVIVDDHPVFRQGISEILNSQNDIKVVAEAANGEEACKLYSELRPDVLMLDLRLPKKDGLQVLLELGHSTLPDRGLLSSQVTIVNKIFARRQVPGPKVSVAR